MTTFPQQITSRPMRDDDDFRRMRNLLLETVPITPIGFNWDMRRLDGKRFYNADLEAYRLLARPVHLWLRGTNELIAFVLSEGPGDAHLQVHPDYRYLEPELVAWAEANLAAAEPGSDAQTLEIYVYEYDALRQQILSARGFTKMSYGGMCRHVRLGFQPFPVSVMPEGYTMRTTDPNDMTDCQRIADLLNAAFGRSFHNALEFHHFAKLAPSYLQSLDLVMVAPDGSFAAYVAIPYDEANRRGIFEPVCTHPAHQRKGLARALMLEGFHRLRALGALDATVDTGDAEAANAFYTAMGFTEAYKGYAWCKRW